MKRFWRKKIIIGEQERGFLFRQGRYQCLLMPGQHTLRGLRKESCATVNIHNAVGIPDADIPRLLQDPVFAEAVECVDVPDGFVALHLVDGHSAALLERGRHCFWRCAGTHQFLPFRLADGEITGLSREQLMYLPTEHCLRIEVPEGMAGLLSCGDAPLRQLKSGVYHFWKNQNSLHCRLVDLRIQQIELAGQEILTADRVCLRLNFVCSFRVKDAIQMVSAVRDDSAQLYSLAQLALREHIARFRFDELLSQKDGISDGVLQALRAKQEDFFVEFTAAGLKDIILPGEIRDIMNCVLVAEKTAQANVIMRREEVASTRSLLNTAKLMEENTTLYQLKELEYLERICDKVGSISVGGSNILMQLRGLAGLDAGA